MVFWLLAAMAVASIFATLSIPSDAIDHDVARGLDDATERGGSRHDAPSGFQVLLTSRPLLIFSVATVGGALSTAAAGLIIVESGYSAAFLFLAAVAGAGLIGFATVMSETLPHAGDDGGG